MYYTPIPTIRVTQIKLKELGLWEEVKKRFGVTDKHLTVNLIVGTKFTKSKN